ncbi:MAG TPA: RagB/SusD family nutrient uptake outer membrane protein [Ohtaekwangia sp.]|nr:RagB/SusD family nutrient uptake outer membrane protein [Ohtaekwangia sp.]
MKRYLIDFLACFVIAALATLFHGCDDFVEIAPPRTELIQQTVFADDNTAEAAVTDIYFTLKSNGFASGGATSISLLTSFSSDEQICYPANSAMAYQQFNNNDLQPDNGFIDILWSDMYRVIFKANAVLEGLSVSHGVSEGVKSRLAGEARFIRAFCYFYLVNLWGDVPLILTTNYRENNRPLRIPVEDVYRKIIDDLRYAAVVLPADYGISAGERVRVNKWAATALLARTYLYREQWSDAEAMASLLIDHSEMFSLESDLAKVFRRTSREAIFQLWSQEFPLDRSSFAVYFFGPLYGAMRPSYIESYAAGDQRWAIWGKNVVVDSAIYPCYFKYKDYAVPPLDYSTVLRLAEQYLIRAEARLRQQKLMAAREDIDIIRHRAELAGTSSRTENALFADVIAERKSELATEWGHRWFDLKRWRMANEILGPIKSGWSANDVLFPIPADQIRDNPSILQNPG